jgi:ribosomal protein S27E
MKATVVDEDGTVRCPVCGATSFVAQRTGKAKLAGATVGLVTLGVGAATIAAMPKRLKCNGCGENLKRGDPPKSPPTARPAADDDWLPSGLRERMAQRDANVDETP